MKTLRCINDSVKYILFIAAVIALLIVSTRLARAESELPTSGEGWNYSASGDLQIESDQGWAGFLKYGFRESVRTLYLGKDVTNCRMYDLPNDVPIPEYYSKEDILGYDWDGNPYYELWLFDGFYPKEIVVDVRNTTFRVSNGLLINTVNNEVVLAKTGLTDVVIPEGSGRLLIVHFVITKLNLSSSLHRFRG